MKTQTLLDAVRAAMPKAAVQRTMAPPIFAWTGSATIVSSLDPVAGLLAECPAPPKAWRVWVEGGVTLIDGEEHFGEATVRVWG